MGRVFNIGLGWELEKIPGSGSGQVGVFIYTIRYLFYSPVFPGIPWYFQVFLGVLDTISFFEGSEPNIKVLSNVY